MTITISDQTFTLLPEKALYQPEQRLLVIADIHLGKVNHFRKEGIAIPAKAQMNDYDNLEKLFKKVMPEQVYFLGDLFHSTYNNDWDNFCNLISQFPEIKFTLIKGNHDIIDHGKFNDICINIVDCITHGTITYSHEELKNLPSGQVNITGHIHPGIVLSGAGRQSIKLPCFYLTDRLVIIPAFGVLTGLYSMEQASGARIYAVLTGEIIRVV